VLNGTIALWGLAGFFLRIVKVPPFSRAAFPLGQYLFVGGSLLSSIIRFTLDQIGYPPPLADALATPTFTFPFKILLCFPNLNHMSFSLCLGGFFGFFLGFFFFLIVVVVGFFFLFLSFWVCLCAPKTHYRDPPQHMCRALTDIAFFWESLTTLLNTLLSFCFLFSNFGISFFAAYTPKKCWGPPSILFPFLPAPNLLGIVQVHLRNAAVSLFIPGDWETLFSTSPLSFLPSQPHCPF